MIDLSTIKIFLSSLAPITGMHYQVWDNNGGVLFSTGKVIPPELPVEESQDLYSLIIDQKVFQYRLCDAHNFLCGIPLRNNQGFLGALVAFGQNPPRPNRNEAGNIANSHNAADMENFLNNLATLVEEKLSVKQEVEEMTHELDNSFEDLYLYSKIATQMKTLRISDDMLKNLVEELLENMRVDAAFAILSNGREYKLRLVKPQVSDKFSEILRVFISAQKNIFEKLIASIPPDASSLKDNYFIINDSRESRIYKDLIPDPYRFLAVRVQHQEEFYGWLGMVSFNLKEIFRQGELKLLLSLAEQLAVVITNTELYRELEQFVVKMVKSLVFAIEAKDMYTRGHSERVSQYCMLMGEQLDLNEKEYNDLKWASILHDIGKIGIPEGILNKPGPLTEAERETINGHSSKGCEILKPVELLADSLPGVMHHHERYDGRGHPQGLKGEAIPLAARIIAVADTFDACSSSRAYREAKSPQEAMAIIEEVAGSQLDPRLVKVFQKVYQENLKSK